MRTLVKGAVLAGAATALYKWFKPVDTITGAASAPNPVRDAGPYELQGIDAKDWDKVDQQSDESFPASDAPGNF